MSCALRSALRRLSAAVALSALTASLVVVATALDPDAADAHGSMEYPQSRGVACNEDRGRNNDMCAQAYGENSWAFHNWMSLSRGAPYTQFVEIDHENVIPDGELCSAGNDRYDVHNLPGEWPVTHLEPGSSGTHELTYNATAPHLTEYYRVYLTGPEFDARTDELAWDDLTLATEWQPDGPEDDRPSEVNFEVELPDREDPAIIYVIWHRSENEEAFYSCSDVTISGGFAELDGASTGSASSTAFEVDPCASGEGHSHHGHEGHDGHEGHEEDEGHEQDGETIEGQEQHGDEHELPIERISHTDDRDWGYAEGWGRDDSDEGDSEHSSHDHHDHDHHDHDHEGHDGREADEPTDGSGSELGTSLSDLSPREMVRDNRVGERSSFSEGMLSSQVRNDLLDALRALVAALEGMDDAEVEVDDCEASAEADHDHEGHESHEGHEGHEGRQDDD